MRVGLFFGTFDPLHNGHLAIAGWVLMRGGVDGLWFVPSPLSPHKQSGSVSDFVARCAALDRVVRALGDGRVGVCRVEGELPRPSYTIDTLRALSAAHRDVEFSLVMGSDNVEGVPGWREGELILQGYRVLVYPRPGHGVSDAFLARYPNVEVFSAPLLSLSSSEIRNWREAGYSTRCFCPLPA